MERVTINVSKPNRFLRNLLKYKWQYGMLLPGLICLFLFSYMPMWGLQIAFKDYSLGDTIAGAKWIGLDNFWFLKDPQFWVIVRNTLTITITKFVFGFPTPIILALMINEITNTFFKRIAQTITYLPHFISWVVVAYILDAFLSPSDGVVNSFLEQLGVSPIFFMGRTDMFVPIVVLTSVWKDIGWGTIIYLAAISSFDVEMYEAATLEGAGRWKQARYITIPNLVPTVIVMLILAVPNLLSAGVDQIYPLMNSANLPVSQVLDTYVLNYGLQQGYFSMASAVGLITSVLGFILIIASNKIATVTTGDGLW
jgi:ABC-type polysaccharide transport system, permease component